MNRQEAIERANDWAACPASQWPHGRRPAPLPEDVKAQLVTVAANYGSYVGLATKHMVSREAWLALRSLARYLAWGLADEWWRAVANVAALHAREEKAVDT